MRIAYFTHSLVSCWNHGNAHFVRGVLRELMRRGHDVTAYEPEGAWSLHNLLADHGDTAVDGFRARYPELHSVVAGPGFDVAAACHQAELVIAHEWNDPLLIAAIGRARRSGRFTLLFHDTHHRAVSEPDALARFDLREYDGVLAFGQTLADIYRRLGWGRRVFVWHEAADTTVFRPPPDDTTRSGLVWVGNWGDGERAAELRDFLFAPARDCRLGLDVFGVRYPADALAMLREHGARYRGWLANTSVPDVLAKHIATVHVPRRYYASALPGIPTIRVFEALACGIPLVSAPWQDSEALFRPGEDFLFASDGAAMRRHLAALRDDPALRATIAANGLATIRARHSCAHRVDELLAIVQTLQTQPASPLTENA